MTTNLDQHRRGGRRDQERGRLAAQRCREAGGSALYAALAAIPAEFAPAMRHGIIKDTARWLRDLPPGHPELALRYRKIAERYPAISLVSAIITVERMYEQDRTARAVAMRTWGSCSKPSVEQQRLTELRLILRWLRRYRAQAFPLIRDVASGRAEHVVIVEAAE